MNQPSLPAHSYLNLWLQDPQIMHPSFLCLLGCDRWGRVSLLLPLGKYEKLRGPILITLQPFLMISIYVPYMCITWHLCKCMALGGHDSVVFCELANCYMFFGAHQFYWIHFIQILSIGLLAVFSVKNTLFNIISPIPHFPPLFLPIPLFCTTVTQFSPSFSSCGKKLLLGFGFWRTEF